MPAWLPAEVAPKLDAPTGPPLPAPLVAPTDLLIPPGHKRSSRDENITFLRGLRNQFKIIIFYKVPIFIQQLVLNSIILIK